MSKRDNFLSQIQKKMHLVEAKSHVDKPSDSASAEDLEAAIKQAELRKIKAEEEFWQQKKEQNTSTGDLQFGLASNQKRYGKRFVLPKGSRRKPWK
jgi:hypothetical protein